MYLKEFGWTKLIEFVHFQLKPMNLKNSTNLYCFKIIEIQSFGNLYNSMDR